jgi:Uma2 family endonuclease
MSLPAHELQLSPEDYLELEQKSEVRHEYVRGRAFAMAGVTEAHDAIVVNLTVLVGSQIRGSGCRVFSSDMKLRVEATGSFYYPDLMVSCEAYAAKAVFKESPSLIFEVLSPSTSDIDRREKLQAYQTIDSLKEYAIVYQDERKIELYRRTSSSNWVAAVYQGVEYFVLNPIPTKEIKLSLDDIYEGVI